MRSKIFKWIQAKETGLLFILVIVLQLMVSAFYMNSKQFYMVDEIFCYEGAHNAMLHKFSSNKTPYRLDHGLDAYYEWITRGEFMEHFEVRGEEKILSHSLPDIRRNLKSNNIYYMLLNIVVSCQSDPAFTKWSGYVLNAIIFVIHQIVLYQIGFSVFKDRRKALLPVFLYGFSAGGITAVVFIRFYLLKSLLCMLMAYVHIRLLEWRNMKGVITAFAVTAAATLCLWKRQPYLVLYAASAMFIFCIACLVIKEYKLLLSYAAVGAAGIVGIVLVFPDVWERFVSYTQKDIGVATISNFVRRPLKEYADYLGFYFMKVLSHTTAGIYGVILVALLLLLVWLWQGRKQVRCTKAENLSVQAACYMAGVTACYFLINSRIQEVKEYRYMICIYAGISVLTAVLIEGILESCKIQYRSAVICGVALIGFIVSYTKGYVDEIYPELGEARECLAEYQGVDSLFIKPKDSVVRYYTDAFMIFEFNPDSRMYLMEPGDVETADYTFLEEADGQGILCWIPVEWEQENPDQRDRILDAVLVRSEYGGYDKLFETEEEYGSSVYYMH